MHTGKVLAIDDEQFIQRLISNEFSLEGFEVVTAKSGEEGLGLFADHYFDLVLLDIKLPQMDGIETLRRIKTISADTDVIMITGFGDVKSAVNCIKLGAADYVTKPFKLDELLALAGQTIQNRRHRHAAPQSLIETDQLEGAEFVHCPSPAMQQVYGMVAKVAPSESTVLILGETGVGKDVLARQIHFNSNRKCGAFVTLDCGLLSRNLAESELYGHRKGAFSGASENRMGLVARSNGGTLFLDEIGNIDLELQKKFLRFLETRRFRRVGDTRETEIDTRVVLATNMDLHEAMNRGEIRRDLLYRMDVISMRIPPLRDRPEDIPVLANYFVNTHPSKTPATRLTDDTLAALKTYNWPGNVRELKSQINKLVILSDTPDIHPRHLPAFFHAAPSEPLPNTTSLEDMEKNHIIRILKSTGGNQSKASEILGINRKTLYKKIHRYGIFA